MHKTICLMILVISACSTDKKVQVTFLNEIQILAIDSLINQTLDIEKIDMVPDVSHLLNNEKKFNNEVFVIQDFRFDIFKIHIVKFIDSLQFYQSISSKDFSKFRNSDGINARNSINQEKSFLDSYENLGVISDSFCDNSNPEVIVSKININGLVNSIKICELEKSLKVSYKEKIKDRYWVLLDLKNLLTSASNMKGLYYIDKDDEYGDSTPSTSPF